MEYQEILFLIGRVIFGVFFLMKAKNHFTKLEMLSGYAASKGTPYSKMAVIFTGLLLTVGGLGILLGIYVEWAIAAIVVFMLGVSFMMHAFWRVPDEAKMSERVNFTKNMAIMGAALMMLEIPEPWLYALF